MFQSPLDIINRGLQICERPNIASLAESSPEAYNMALAYDKVREYELQRNMWTFATRRVFLRVLDTTTVSVTFPAYASGTTYARSAIVSSGGLNWSSLTDGNVGHTPGVVPASGPLLWEAYYGPTVANLWSGNANVATNATNLPTVYHIGDLVYTTPGDGTAKVYVALAEISTTLGPETPDVWVSTIMYPSGAVVSFNGTNYQSRVALNFNYEPDTSSTQWTSTVTNPTVSSSWLLLTSATVAMLRFNYPTGAGPSSDSRTLNAFKLPDHYLKRCPPNPKEGLIPYLGGPSGNTIQDWNDEGGLFTSREFGPLMMRFIASVQDVTTFHPMFCEGLAAALTISTNLPSAVSIRDRRAHYATVIRDARTQNAIEVGKIQQPEDAWISVRF